MYYDLTTLITIFFFGIGLGISFTLLVAGKFHIFPKYGEIKFPFQKWMQVKR